MPAAAFWCRYVAGNWSGLSPILRIHLCSRDGCTTKPTPKNVVQASRLHMPKAHQSQAEWTPKRLVRWAQRSGPSVAQLVSEVMGSRPHPQQDFRSCLGIMRLGERFGRTV